MGIRKRKGVAAPVEVRETSFSGVATVKVESAYFQLEKLIGSDKRRRRSGRGSSPGRGECGPVATQ